MTYREVEVGNFQLGHVGHWCCAKWASVVDDGEGGSVVDR